MNRILVLFNKLRTLWLMIGAVLVGYSVAALIAFAGSNYFGGLLEFMQVFRSLALTLMLIRVVVYGWGFCAWRRWKTQQLAASGNDPKARRCAQRIELTALAVIALLEAAIWNFHSAGGDE